MVYRGPVKGSEGVRDLERPPEIERLTWIGEEHGRPGGAPAAARHCRRLEARWSTADRELGASADSGRA